MRYLPVYMAVFDAWDVHLNCIGHERKKEKPERLFRASHCSLVDEQFSLH